MTRKLQRLAVFSDRAHNVIRNARRYLGLYLQHDLNLGAHKAGEMRDDLFSNEAGVPPHPGDVQRYGAMKALGLRW